MSLRTILSTQFKLHLKRVGPLANHLLSVTLRKRSLVFYFLFGDVMEGTMVIALFNVFSSSGKKVVCSLEKFKQLSFCSFKVILK